MKSLVEEASTIGKAIEAAWNRAGKPQSFSIKIFEQPEYNFLGMTKKYGKVAIFFEEIPVKEGSGKRNNGVQDQSKYGKRANYEDKNVSDATAVNSVKQKRNEQLEPSHRALPAAKNSETVEKRESLLPKKKKEIPKNTETEYVWTENMISFLHDFVSQTITCMGRTDVSFEFKKEQTTLKIIFHGLLVSQQAKEASFYKNLAHLMVTALRTKFKTEFKHLRLVLAREE